MNKGWQEHMKSRAGQPEPEMDGLVDINTIIIDPEAPYEERIREYVRQIGNPCCYLDQGFTVTCSFAGERTLEECMAEYLRGRSGMGGEKLKF